MSIKSFFLAFMAFLLSACGSMEPSCAPPDAMDKVYVVEHGWHAELGIPVDKLSQNLAFLRDVFPDARAIIFGYGKKTFFTAPPQTISEYLLGPFPGSAVIQVIGLNVMPDEAYGKEDTALLSVNKDGMRALSDYIWGDLAKDGQGKAIVVAPSTRPDGLFYATISGYSLFHTCNAWAADALHSAGLPIDSDGIVFSGQVISQVNDAAIDQCRLTAPN